MKTILAMGLALWGTAATACSDIPLNFNWNTASDDQRVSGEFVKKTVLGRQVRYEDGYEDYRANGDYFYVTPSQRFTADGYVFYADGSRCLNYPTPRYDLYVIRGNKLWVINQGGGRFEGRVTQ